MQTYLYMWFFMNKSVVLVMGLGKTLFETWKEWCPACARWNKNIGGGWSPGS